MRRHCVWLRNYLKLLRSMVNTTSPLEVHGQGRSTTTVSHGMSDRGEYRAWTSPADISTKIVLAGSTHKARLCKIIHGVCKNKRRCSINRLAGLRYLGLTKILLGPSSRKSDYNSFLQSISDADKLLFESVHSYCRIENQGDR